MTQARRPSPLQKRVLIMLAFLDAKCPGPVLTRDIERVLEQGGEAPVYGPNLRASCRRMEAAGWLRTLRAPNLQLAVELTATGREIALPLLHDEKGRTRAEQRATEVAVMPLAPVSPPLAGNNTTADLPVRLDNVWHLAFRGDYVVRLDGTTCLQLWNSNGHPTRLTGDPLQVAHWLQACHDAGIEIRMQINESHTSEEGSICCAIPTDQTDTWYCQLKSELLSLGISGLTESERQAVVTPEENIRSLPAPARLLHVLRESPESYVLCASTYEEETGDTLDALLAQAGFTPAQAQVLRWNRIRWPLMDEEDYSRLELNSLLDELEQRQLFCNRDQLLTLVFSPVRKAEESWTERLQWLLSTDGFGFHSPLSREKGERVLNYLAGYVGQDAADQLATYVAWAEDQPPEKP